MTVPDDVILLWTDDNWGDLRRYPTLNERNRTGGAGVYYHVSDGGLIHLRRRAEYNLLVRHGRCATGL